jgi:hypothetical protein
MTGLSRGNLGTNLRSAAITVDGPGGDDRTPWVSDVQFATEHGRDRAEVTCTLAGRSVALRVPA